MNELIMLGNFIDITNETNAQARVYDGGYCSNYRCFELWTREICMYKRLQVFRIRMERTEQGKRLRKQYESHQLKHGFNQHRNMEYIDDGLCNTISTIQKDFLILEMYGNSKD